MGLLGSDLLRGTKARTLLSKTGGKKTEAEAEKLVNRSTDMFDWQQNQPMEGCKLLLRFNLSLVSLVKFLSGFKPFNLLIPYRFN